MEGISKGGVGGGPLLYFGRRTPENCTALTPFAPLTNFDFFDVYGRPTRVAYQFAFWLMHSWYGASS